MGEKTQHLEAPRGQASVGVDAAEAHGKPSRARRTMHILAAVLVAVVLPALLTWALVGEFGAIAMFIGIMLGGVGAKLGGTRRMLVLAPVMGLAAGLGAFTAYDWWWAALLATVAAIAGAGIGFGWFAPLLMVPYAATFVPPLSSARDAVIYGVIVAIGTLYGVVIMRRFGAPEVVDGDAFPCRSPPVWQSCSASSWVAPRRLALRWDGPSRTGFRSRSHPGALHPHREARQDTGKGDRYIARGCRRDTRGAHRSACMGPRDARNRRVPSRAHADPDVLALLRAVHVLARPRSCRSWSGRLRGRGTRRSDLVGIGLLVIGLFIVHALATWLSKRHPQPEPTAA